MRERDYEPSWHTGDVLTGKEYRIVTVQANIVFVRSFRNGALPGFALLL